MCRRYLGRAYRNITEQLLTLPQEGLESSWQASAFREVTATVASGNTPVCSPP